MQRIQVSLEPDLSAALDRLARQQVTSRNSLLRRAVRELLSSEAPVEEDPILGLIGLGNGGVADVSERHDYHLAEITLKEMAG